MRYPLLPMRILLVLGLFLACAAAWAGGNEVAGTYRVEGVTDLGPEMRVTLHIHLINNSANYLSITKVALHDVRPRRNAVETAAWSRLEPRHGTTADREFVVSRQEYERWRRGAHPMLQVALQAEGGREVVRTIPLRPSRDRRPQ